MTPRRSTAVVLLCAVSVVASIVAPARAEAQKPTAGKPAPAKPAPATAPATVAAPAMTPIPVPTQLSTVEGITEFSLPNGLKVLLFPDGSKPTVTVNVTYLVGSRHEGYGETGMAHLLEHMMYKGSPKTPNMPKELEARGASYNGTTSFDRTNYYETVAGTDENLAWAIDFEADRMTHSNIAKKDLETEFTVVRNEFESGENSPTAVLYKRLLAVAYDWHNYGHVPIGARADIEGVPIERLQAFYRRYYQPDNAVLVVAGKFDQKKALGLIAEKFGALPKPDRALEKGNLLFPTYTRDQAQDGERQVTLRRVGDVQAVAALYHVPGGVHPDYPAIRVLGFVLGDSPSGRLYKALIETKKAAQAFAQGQQLREPGPFVVFAQVAKDGNLAAAQDAMLATVEGLASAPVTQEEVDRAKTALQKDIELSLNSSQRSAIDLSEWASIGDWRLLFYTRDKLKAVTAADVNRVALAYFKSTNRTLGQFIPTEKPERAEISEAPDGASLVKDYKGAGAVAAGESFDVSPANVDARTQRKTLANGFSTALLSKKNRGEAVTAIVTLRYGTPSSLMNLSTVSQLTASMLSRGTTTKTRQQVKDAFDQLKANVFISGSGNTTTARVVTTRPNLASALALLADELKAPAFDSTEFATLMQQQITAIESQKSEPQTLAIIEIQRRLEPKPVGAVGYTETIPEAMASLKAATLTQVKDFHRRFYGGKSGSLVVVGDFDADSTAKLATSLFGTWTAPEKVERVPTAYTASKDTVVSIETPDKANALVAAALNVPMRDDDADFAALVLGTYAFGGSPLGSRLVTRLRQKEGVSYAAGAQFAARPQDASATLLLFAIFAPENAARLEGAMRDELSKVVTEGFTDEEIERNKTGWLQQQQQQRAADGALAASLSSQLYLGRTMQYDAQIEAKVKSLTAAQVNAAVKKYFDPSKLVLVKAGDFAGKAKAAAAQVKP